MDFLKYIKAVGTGVKGNRDLSFEESKEMMTLILENKVYPEQVSAFLLGWRMKPETIEEFRGALSACEQYIKKSAIKNSLELAYPFDSKTKNPYLFPLIAKVLENSDLSLVISGDVNQSLKQGNSPKYICEKMQLTSNLHYFDRADFFPQMHNLTDVRRKLGLRTGLNTLEKLSNIAQSEFAICGVFHKPYVKKYTEIFADKYKRFALIQGNEGSPELFSKGHLWIVENEKTEELMIDPKYYGIDYEKSLEKISMEESLEVLTNPSDEHLKLAKLNAAIYLFVSKNAKSIDEAYEMLI